MSYCRVTSKDRLRIKDGLDSGLSNRTIADKLGFHKSTIGREIRRNTGLRGYRPKQADHGRVPKVVEIKKGVLQNGLITS